MVYVLNKDGKPLMPTKRHGKVKHLLRSGKAIIVQRTPFTIQLAYGSTSYTQPITLGVDAGSKNIGLSATTEKKELYAAEVKLRTDIVDLISARRNYRRTRRNRTTRYRQPRFNNRKRFDGWLAPSVQQKVDTHIKVIADVHKILPITKIVFENATFDIQKLKNPKIQGAEYQRGEQCGFWNVREYVIWRDNHKCQSPKCSGKDKVLRVHHIEDGGGDAPNNLITLCSTCNTLHHRGKVVLDFKRGDKYKDATFMNVVRHAAYKELKKLYPTVEETFGHITKNTRIALGLEKTHAVDAYCATGNADAKMLDRWYLHKAVRHNNRQIHKATISKGGYRKANQAPKYVFGYQLFDKVLCKGKVGFVFARRQSGSFAIRTLDGERLTAGITYKKLKPLEKRRTILTEIRDR